MNVSSPPIFFDNAAAGIVGSRKSFALTEAASLIRAGDNRPAKHPLTLRQKL